MYGELKCFIKPFTRLETSSTSLNNHLKILQKILIHDFRSVENYFWSIKCSFRLVKQESSSNRNIQRLQDFFFTVSIDRTKVSTNQKCLTLNFHLENSRTWIFTYFMKQYSPNLNIIIITTYPCLYLYKHLSSLTCFSLRCSFEFPTLKMVRVKKIPKMESFSDESQRTPQLKAINVTFVG